MVAIPCGFDSHLLHQQGGEQKFFAFFDFQRERERVRTSKIGIVPYVFMETYIFKKIKKVVDKYNDVRYNVRVGSVNSSLS